MSECLIGIDISAKTFNACVGVGVQRYQYEFSNDTKGYRSLLSKLKKQMFSCKGINGGNRCLSLIICSFPESTE